MVAFAISWKIIVQLLFLVESRSTSREASSLPLGEDKGRRVRPRKKKTRPAASRGSNTNGRPKVECTREWIIILGTGRSGTTSALKMLNGLPGVALSGEHYGYIRELRSIEHKVERTSHMHGPAWQHRPFNKDTFYCWARSLLEADESKKITGFKEIRYNDFEMLEFLVRLFPSAKFLITYRNELAEQLKSHHKAHGFSTTSIDKLRAETQALLDFHQRYPHLSYLLPLEHFSTQSFSELFHWLGFSKCNAIDIVHANRNGGYADDFRRTSRYVHCSTSSNALSTNNNSTMPSSSANSTSTSSRLSLHPHYNHESKGKNNTQRHSSSSERRKRRRPIRRHS